MINIDLYYEDDHLRRDKIVLDIKNGKLNKEDLNQLISDPRIQEAFFGDGYKEKKPKEEWDEDYLNKLTYVAVAEAFNEDYLRYLAEVSSYVRDKESNNTKYLKLIIVIGGILLVLIVVFMLTKHN